MQYHNQTFLKMFDIDLGLFEENITFVSFVALNID